VGHAERGEELMPATLNTYLQQAQRLLRDTRQEMWNPDDLREYCNMARREVAMRSQSIRHVPRMWGAIMSATITNGGTGYTNPTVTITPPDSPSGELPFPNGNQATGSATQTGGVIDSVFILYGGDGYFQPQITIHDPTGTGATAVPNMSPISQVLPGREVYQFSEFDLSVFPGVASIYAIRSVSILFAQWRYSVAIYSFSEYQAKIRSFASGSFQWIPTYGTQFGRGSGGSLYLYPLPSQPYQMEIDCSCLPQDLLTNLSVEAIPDPWTDAVPYWMAYMAYLEGQNHNSARLMQQLFDERMTRFGAYAAPGRAINRYGRL
jgi:hypothetical protein